jgi:hypothetical protein
MTTERTAVEPPVAGLLDLSGRVAIVAELDDEGWAVFVRSHMTAQGHSEDRIEHAISRYLELERKIR